MFARELSFTLSHFRHYTLQVSSDPLLFHEGICLHKGDEHFWYVNFKHHLYSSRSILRKLSFNEWWQLYGGRYVENLKIHNFPRVVGFSCSIFNILMYYIASSVQEGSKWHMVVSMQEGTNQQLFQCKKVSSDTWPYVTWWLLAEISKFLHWNIHMPLGAFLH